MTWRQALRRREVSDDNEKTVKPERVARLERVEPPERVEKAEKAEKTAGSEGTAVAAGSRRRPPVHPVVRALAMVIAFVGTVLFGVVLARLTLEPSAASAALVHSNVRPGHSISAYLDGTSTIEAVRQLGGNLLMGVPFGVLLPVLLPPARGLLRVAVVTVALMTLVELTQGALVTGRVFDIDDVILNTSGALLGYLFIGLRLGRAVHPRRRHWWHR
ncbi:VanZ like protein [Streptomyces sp. CG 926]|uniref:VanZ family protein n=1 Tax=Streptomyces sp. CG 926 TaxID=1882405 RepID=UPI000D79A4B5|nr:VanZ family protein [Streptomyces sp. CG 926]PWK64835.1 VanZ like protein [Streptomyces sp. CG 926]